MISHNSIRDTCHTQAFRVPPAAVPLVQTIVANGAFVYDLHVVQHWRKWINVRCCFVWRSAIMRSQHVLQMFVQYFDTYMTSPLDIKPFSAVSQLTSMVLDSIMLPDLGGSSTPSAATGSAARCRYLATDNKSSKSCKVSGDLNVRSINAASISCKFTYVD